MKGSRKSFHAVLAARGGAKSKFSKPTSASQRGCENCLISSGTAAAFRFTKEIFVPPYYAYESRRCLCRHCCQFQTKYFLVSCQLVPSCCTTHYRGNLLLLLLPRLLHRGVPSTLPLRFDFGSTARIARACGSAARSFSLRLFSPRLLNFAYCSSLVFVHGREGLAKILSCSPCRAWRSKI